MFLFSKPTAEFIRNFTADQQSRSLTYDAVGWTRDGQAPDGFTVDHNRIRLGEGRETFERAIEAVKRWEMFSLIWTDLYFKDTLVDPGQTVALLIEHFGFWSLNAARIVYVIERQPGPVEKFGFAYGTLPEHGEKGEERFTIELHEVDKSVWYDIFAFSQPNHLMAKVGYPVGRYLQKCFVRDSKQAMFNAVNIG